ncbi:hypothetical protein R1sor_012244 [Riccia sorocarpa]|uniref:Uncharacterized protein n=1 Tax=Riccia sorocarpa TaxID=122646 RepID=A0ABD3I3K2_9MARC
MACAIDFRIDLNKSSLVGPLELPRELLGEFTGEHSEEEPVNITHLPAVLVSDILSRIPSPIDVAFAVVASRIFWSVAQTTSFRLKLHSRPRRSLYGARGRATWAQTVIAGIRRTMSTTEELDLSECPISDINVGQLLFDLPNLERLILDDCQNLTSYAVGVLSKSGMTGLRALSLQRCLRLGPSAGETLLTATTVGSSRLQTLLLSHLERVGLLQDTLLPESTGRSISNYTKLVKDVASNEPRSSLRVLALNNCSNIGPSQLAMIAEACPNLEIWMLGGSAHGLYMHGYTKVDLDTGLPALIQAAKRLPKLRILEITFFSKPVLDKVRAQISPGVHVWDFRERNSVTAAANLVAHLKGCSIPMVGKGPAVKAWCDWCTDGSHTDHPLDEESTVEYSGEGCIDMGCDILTKDILLALKAGVNCTGPLEKTPLHFAAYWGDTNRVAKLLFLGASAGDMKESDGDTALIEAARSGYAEICKLLLREGADVLTRSADGETPLYLAAFYEHPAALEVMLAHCLEKGIDWQADHMYVSEIFTTSDDSFLGFFASEDVLGK